MKQQIEATDQELCELAQAIHKRLQNRKAIVDFDLALSAAASTSFSNMNRTQTIKRHVNVRTNTVATPSENGRYGFFIIKDGKPHGCNYDLQAQWLFDKARDYEKAKEL